MRNNENDEISCSTKDLDNNEIENNTRITQEKSQIRIKPITYCGRHDISQGLPLFTQLKKNELNISNYQLNISSLQSESDF